MGGKSWGIPMAQLSIFVIIHDAWMSSSDHFAPVGNGV